MIDENIKNSTQDEWMDYREAARLMHRPKEYFGKRWLDGQFKYWPEIERWQPGGRGTRLYVRREHVEHWIKAQHSPEPSPIRQILNGVRL